MSLISYIENLRDKPVHVRKHYAFWTSFGVTAVIFLFWLSTATSLGTKAQGQIAKVASSVGTPAQSLLASVGSFAGDIKELIFGAKKITYSTVEVSPGNR